MAYFENMVAGQKLKVFAIDIPDNAIEILTKALAYQNLSMVMYDLYVESKSENDWKSVCEHDQRSQGLLDAYKIIACREVMNNRHAIFEEIVFLATTFEREDLIPDREIQPHQL